jgi:hypothetical protein
MKRRRPTTRLCPAPERLEEKRVPSTLAGLTSVPAVHVHSTHETAVDVARWAQVSRAHAHRKPPHGAAGNGAGAGAGNVGGNGTGVGVGVGVGVGAGVGNGSRGRGSGSGTGVGGGFGWGAGQNTTALTLVPDNGALGASFGLVMVESTPLLGGAVYNLALVTVRNSTSQTLTVQSGLSFAVTGTSAAQPFPAGTYLWQPGQLLVLISLTEDTFPPNFTFNLQGTTVQEPANLYYGIQYSPITLPNILGTIVPTLVGGRYALVTA